MEIKVTISQDKRYKAELEIIQELGRVPSSREMQKLLKDKYGIIVTHSIVNQDLKKDLEALTPQEYTNQKEGILKMLDAEIDIAHTIATSDPDNDIKLKAMSAVSKLSKTKTEVLIKFKKAQVQLSKEDKPEINIFIGQPKEIDLKKFERLKGVTENEEKTE